jgi:hypothetical protein
MSEVDKGAPDCRCECCVYWRRRAHRIAADADGRTGRVKSILASTQREMEHLRNRCDWLTRSRTPTRPIPRRKGFLERVCDTVFG